jgi:hypothetical protein
MLARLLSAIGDRLGELRLLDRGRKNNGRCLSVLMFPSLLVSLELSDGVEDNG